MQRGVNRQSALDGMRGVAALSVLAVHIWIYQLPNTVALRRGGWEKTVLFELRVAFVLFFVLSGYLLYRGFARAALARAGRVSTASYLVRRAARVLPAYYVALFGTLALLSLAGNVPGRRVVPAEQLPLFFAFAQNYSPATLLKLNAATWTLSVEIAFYLALPLAGLLALRAGAAVRRQALLLASFVAAGLGWNLAYHVEGWGAVAKHAPPAFLAYFACGMLVAVLVEWRHASAAQPLSRRLSGSLVAGAAVMLVINGYWHAASSAHAAVIDVVGDLGAAIAFAAAIAAVVLGTGAGLRWLAWRPLAWTGQITYGLYLWHIPLIVFFRGNGLLPGGALSYLVVLPAAVALGAASWYLLEQPLMRKAAGLGRTRPASRRDATSARSARLRSRTPARIAPRPASLSARAGGGQP